jgi:hypothetical protein
MHYESKYEMKKKLIYNEYTNTYNIIAAYYYLDSAAAAPPTDRTLILILDPFICFSNGLK